MTTIRNVCLVGCLFLSGGFAARRYLHLPLFAADRLKLQRQRTSIKRRSVCCVLCRLSLLTCVCVRLCRILTMAGK